MKLLLYMSAVMPAKFLLFYWTLPHSLTVKNENKWKYDLSEMKRGVHVGMADHEKQVVAHPIVTSLNASYLLMYQVS